MLPLAIMKQSRENDSDSDVHSGEIISWNSLTILKFKSKLTPSVLKYLDKVATTSSQKSAMFNSYFHSVSSDTNDDMSLPDLSEQLITSLSTIKFTEYDVIKVLKQLDINKGTPPNNIHLLILHNYANELAPSLTVLFNRSLSVGKILSVWKHAYIVPIHEKDSKEMVENYRPISLLNNVSKVIERLVFNHVYPVIEPCISHAQHGFIHKSYYKSNKQKPKDVILLLILTT